MDIIQMNPISLINKDENAKIDNIDIVEAVGVPTDIKETKANQVDVSENIAKSTEGETRETIKKHIIVFIANGFWVDNKQVTWSKKKSTGIVSTKEFTDNEFATRDDIKFMIEYGAMTHTEVSL